MQLEMSRATNTSSTISTKIRIETNLKKMKTNELLNFQYYLHENKDWNKKSYGRKKWKKFFQYYLHENKDWNTASSIAWL